MRDLTRAIELLADKTAHLSMWLLVPMFGISLYEVVSRYFFSAPTTWGASMISILFIAAVVPAGADLAATHGHVRMDAFYSRWSIRSRAAADLLGSLLLICFAGVLAWKASEMAWHSVSIVERTWGVFRAPIYPKKLAFALGAILLLLEAFALFVRSFRSLKKTGDVE